MLARRSRPLLGFVALCALALPACAIEHVTPGLRPRPDDDVATPGDDVVSDPDVVAKPCGERNQTCCPGDLCNNGITCQGQTCLCGGSGQVCCPDDMGQNVVCDTSLSCIGGACDCGGEGASCCAGATPCGPSLQCEGGHCVCGAVGQTCCAEGRCASGSTCISGRCTVAPLCVPDGMPCATGTSPGCCAGLLCPAGTGAHCTTTITCGQAGQPCCPGDVCEGGAACVNPLNVGPACVSCGGPGQACCPGNQCREGASCAAGSGAVSAYGSLCVATPTGGAPGQHCPSTACDSNAFCRGFTSAVRRCVVCGGRNETCCSRGACGGGLQCSSPDTSGSWICIPL